MSQDAFASRSYAELSRAKLARRAARYRMHGPAFDEAAALYAHAKRVRPPFPTAEERHADLEHHIEMRAKLDRTAHVITVR